MTFEMMITLIFAIGMFVGSCVVYKITNSLFEHEISRILFTGMCQTVYVMFIIVVIGWCV